MHSNIAGGIFTSAALKWVSLFCLALFVQTSLMRGDHLAICIRVIMSWWPLAFKMLVICRNKIAIL